MPSRYNLYQIDSFTREKLSGNPAGVITNADGLKDNQMQRIARELNNSETAFIFKSSDPAYDVHVRFFTPTHEVPICGHATVAAHYARAIEGKLNSCLQYHKTGAGILPIEILREEGDYKIVMTQGEISFGEILTGKILDELLAGLKINMSSLIENFPVQIASTGHSKVMIGVKEESLLHQLKPNMEILKQVSAKIGCNGFYVFTVHPDDPDILVHGRMFAPAIGIEEDPVTGNANGPLGAYLIHHRLLPHNSDAFRFNAKQGEAIGRPGIIEVEVKVCEQQPVEVKISGYAVIAFKADLLFD